MSAPFITVVRSGPGTTIQDGGRPGHMYQGVPPGGPLIPELLRAANESLGNDAGAAALEILSAATLRATSDATVSLDGVARRLEAGVDWTLVPREAAAYVALPGGIDVPVVLGSRGTLVVASLGGVDGRELRSGDGLRAMSDHAVPRELKPPEASPDRPIRVVLGPDPFPTSAVERLLTTTFRVGPADRVGMRLVGTTLGTAPADTPGAMPMVRGAIQITGDGYPIVLGPDHPTTGGYRVIAVVCTNDLGELARRRNGAPVRFTRAA